MRGQALALGRLHDSTLHVIDVGSGTGFTTQGIVKSVNARQVVCVDQSPHQQQKAKAKSELNACTFSLGDAEHIPYETDRFDRYVSAGSIEYWPNPQQGIRNGLFGSCSRNPVAMRNEKGIEFRSVSII